MSDAIRKIGNKLYPYYLHGNKEFVEYWKKYFDEYPLLDTDRLQIYIDFPFCRSRCKFCVFGSNLYEEYKDKIHIYENAVVSLVKDMKDVFPERVNNVYFGGGTPSLWSRDALIEIINNIPSYHNANTRTIEIHPFDLNDDLLDFVINDLNIKTVSIGIQSFDIQSNKDQHRIPANVDSVKHAVDVLHSHGRYVNIDLVALFNYEDNQGWEIYKNDLEILINEIHPDDICSNPNFRISNYYGKSIKFREILKEIIEKYPEYTLEHPNSISTDINDIVKYGQEAYHLRTKEYHEFFNNCKVGLLDNYVDILKNNLCIGFGGSINEHSGISRIGKILEDIHSGFSFNSNSNRFIHKVIPTQVYDPAYDSTNVPLIQIGNVSIDSNIKIESE